MFQLGVERIAEFPKVFKGKRLGLIASVSSADRQLRPTSGLLLERYDLRALYGPEHGVRGAIAAGEIVDGAARDKATGLPVYSLYRKDGKRLTGAMVENVDALVYDIQDLGLRFYTYISTLLYALEDCARFNKELIVLDRPAPLGGLAVEGGLIQPGFESFVGCYRLPIRYGMTAGEFVQMVNDERKLGCALTVIPMTDWHRQQMFFQLGYPFLMPSPSIPHFSTALLYAGTCLLEGVNVSEGRGTADPFALIGAPYIDAEELCRATQTRQWRGVLQTPAYFTPASGKYAGEPCQGVHLHLTHPEEYEAIRVGVELIELIRKLYPDKFAFLPPTEDESRPMIDLLTGGDELRSGESTELLLERWVEESSAFRQRASVYDLY